MRVLMLSAAWPPAGRGGYEGHAAQTAAGLARRGHRVLVLTAREGCGEELVVGAVEVRRVLERFEADASWPGWTGARGAEKANRRALAREVARWRPEVACLWRMAELSMSLVTEHGLPAVGVCGDAWLLEGPPRDPWARATGRPGPVTLAGAARWLFVSAHLRDRVARELPQVADAPVVHPGVDLAALPARGAAPEWRGELLYAGRLSELKGVQDAVAALVRLPEASLRVLGHGPPAVVGRLRAQAEALGVADRLALEGAVSPEALAAAYAQADAVLFPSRWAEPWGLVGLEAMAVGVPVVATGTGGSVEYLRDGVNALLHAPGDPAALAAAVQRLAGDAALRARLVAEGRRTAAAHPAEACTAVIEGHLREVLAASRQPAVA